MTPLEIKIELLKAGISIRQLARKEGVSHTAMSYTIHGVNKGLRLREAVARALGKSVEEIWPPESNAIGGHCKRMGLPCQRLKKQGV
jgi:lambda repressor-like predicted transcriptional regulator